MEINKPTEAMNHFQKSLKLKQRLSGDLLKDKSLLNRKQNSFFGICVLV